MTGTIDKAWIVSCGVAECDETCCVQVSDKRFAAMLFHEARWVTRHGLWVCAEHAVTIPRGEHP